MSTIKDVLNVLRSRGDDPEMMEQVLQTLPKEERAKLKDTRITLIDQLDCPKQTEALASFYEMIQIVNDVPDVSTNESIDNTWRIYLWGRPSRVNKVLIDWCRDAVKNGKLPKRVDENGNLYIYVNDLLPHKGEFYKATVQSDTIDIMSILSDSIIAGGEVKGLADKILADGASNIQYGYLPDLRAGRLGYVAAYNAQGVGPYLQNVGLGDWL